MFDFIKAKLLTGFSSVGPIYASKYLVQYEVNLIILDIREISRDLFHQILLQDYGNFDAMPIVPPVPLKDSVIKRKTEAH